MTPSGSIGRRQRIGRLPQTAQTALLIAAADTTGDMPAVLRAMARLGLPVDALDPAEGAVLVQISGATITFRHPLVRSALYQGATLSRPRCRAHLKRRPVQVHLATRQLPVRRQSRPACPDHLADLRVQTI
jgi:hypothetical protein